MQICQKDRIPQSAVPPSRMAYHRRNPCRTANAAPSPSTGGQQPARPCRRVVELHVANSSPSRVVLLMPRSHALHGRTASGRTSAAPYSADATASPCAWTGPRTGHKTSAVRRSPSPTRRGRCRHAPVADHAAVQPCCAVVVACEGAPVRSARPPLGAASPRSRRRRPWLCA